MSPTTRSMRTETEQDDSVPTITKIVKRSVKDPIHDLITLDSRMWAFIDTRQFQRLRSIKQLGTSYFVWPGASHNRFEHCIGVAYFARLMAEHLQKSQPELGITDRDVHCVELAGLCHDLGHGPWSHVWDSLFIPIALKGKKWKHEDASEMMFDDLVEKNEIKITEQDAKFVKALIAGDLERCGNPPEKPFLFEIVANKRNGIDVDKFDYIMRDGHAIGDKGNLSLSKLIQSARVIDNQICYDIKDANQMYELCYTRFSLHKRIYNHKTAKAIEYMVIDALLAAEPHMKIADQIDKPEQYVFLTDDIMPRIEMSNNPELAESRAIFDRLRTRDLYRCVDYKVIAWEHRAIFRARITPQAIVAAAKTLPRDPPPLSLEEQDQRDEVEEGNGEAVDIEELLAEHVIVDLAEMHYGMKEKNPLDFVRFYSKNHSNQCAQVGPGDMSTIMPAVFAEVLLRVYTRDVRYFGIIQAGYRVVLQAVAEDISPGIPPLTPISVVTPPAAPSTPRVRHFGRSESFSNNTFTTVSTNFVPESPLYAHKKPRSKRGLDKTDGGGSPPLKRKKPFPKA